MGALNYNLKKLSHPDPRQRAELLSTNFASMDASYIRKELNLVRALRPNLNRYVYHTSLNFHPDDKVDNDKLLKIAHEYLEGLGFTNNQYFIFRHHDAEHPHLHLLVNRITFDGGVVSDSNNFKHSEKILRSIELRYNLIQVNQFEPSQIKQNQLQMNRLEKTQLRAATKDELEMVIRTGKPSDKMLLQEKLMLILQQPKLSLQDFIRQTRLKVFICFSTNNRPDA